MVVDLGYGLGRINLSAGKLLVLAPGQKGKNFPSFKTSITEPRTIEGSTSGWRNSDLDRKVLCSYPIRLLLGKTFQTLRRTLTSTAAHSILWWQLRESNKAFCLSPRLSLLFAYSCLFPFHILTRIASNSDTKSTFYAHNEWCWWNSPWQIYTVTNALIDHAGYFGM